MKLIDALEEKILCLKYNKIEQNEEVERIDKPNKVA